MLFVAVFFCALVAQLIFTVYSSFVNNILLFSKIIILCLNLTSQCCFYQLRNKNIQMKEVIVVTFKNGGLKCMVMIKKM